MTTARALHVASLAAPRVVRTPAPRDVHLNHPHGASTCSARLRARGAGSRARTGRGASIAGARARHGWLERVAPTHAILPAAVVWPVGGRGERRPRPCVLRRSGVRGSDADGWKNRRGVRALAVSGDDAEGDADAVGSDDPAPVGTISRLGDALDVIRSEMSRSGGTSGATGQLYAYALASLVAIHVRDPGWGIWNVVRVVGSLILGGGLAFKGLRSGSLDKSGALAATAVGWGTLYAGVRFGTALGVFFFASSAMTRVGKEVKRKIDEHFVEGKEAGGRNWVQVLANGLVPTVCAMTYCFATGGPEHLLGVNNAFETPLAAAFIGYYGCCCGDTWGSELGVLSKSSPRLITNPGKVVRPGTNGGVTALGLAASAAGGAAVGIAFWLGGLFVPLANGEVGAAVAFAAQWPVLVIGAGAGLVGSLLDSLLGATVQFSGYCSERGRMVSKPGPTVEKISGLNFLSNSMVNFVSACTCAVVLYYGTIYAGLPRV